MAIGEIRSLAKAMSDDVGENPGGWGVRRASGDGATPAGTNGPKTGASRAALAWGWLVGGALIALVDVVNVMTDIDDARRRGVTLPLWLPASLQATSFVADLPAMLVIVAALKLAPIGRSPVWRTGLVHLAASVLFSAAHVAVMTALRSAIFVALGHRYPFSWTDAPYEYRKDAITYFVMAAIFWVMPRLRPGTPMSTPPAAASSTATFDIRDGVSILRVRLSEIVAVQAAGNYVEFLLADARRPLMRASMAEIGRALAAEGFLRTHRSWRQPRPRPGDHRRRLRRLSPRSHWRLRRAPLTPPHGRARPPEGEE
jgi:hypothetical protein